MTAGPQNTEPAGWPRAGIIRCNITRARTWLCSRICDGYDRPAGQIIDSLEDEVDCLREGGRR